MERDKVGYIGWWKVGVIVRDRIVSVYEESGVAQPALRPAWLHCVVLTKKRSPATTNLLNQSPNLSHLWNNISEILTFLNSGMFM